MKTKTNEYADELAEIALLADELIRSECSTTSQHFQDWCDAEAEAKFLIRLLKSRSLESDLQQWISETLTTLRMHLSQ